jgi:ribonucleoside-diphosphate reductase alpha chain
MHLNKFRKILSKPDLKEIEWAFDMVREKRCVPSMRSLQFSGKSIEVNNARIFNCSVRHIDGLRSFAEYMFLALCGCGIGNGYIKKFMDRLPDLVNAKDKTGSVITYSIEDSIEGWSDSIEALLLCYFKNTAYTGRKIVFDYSKIRPEGSPLKTSGGKAPGYKGLKRTHVKIKELLDHVIETLGQKRLKTINAYDILMHCSDAVLSGGVRRSASIAFFSYDDSDMINAKINFPVTKHTKFYQDDDTKKFIGKVSVNGKKYDVELTEWEYNELLLKKKEVCWIHIEPQRARSNNSVLLDRKTTTFEQFRSIVENTKQYGEPGFAFVDNEDSLLNPCAEIGFIPITKSGIPGVQFCNLSEINGAKVKNKEDFLIAAKAASIIGTLQASYTNFKYLGNAAKELTDEEALLGVSITGYFDNPTILLDEKNLREGAEIVKTTNEIWAKKLGINPAARTTCSKPSGTASIVLGSSSGAHAHHSHLYFRRIQCNKHDPVFKFFKKHNPHMVEESLWSANKTDEIVTFPISIPEGVLVKEDITALKHLEIIKKIQENWVIPGTSNFNSKSISNNVSCTVLVKDDEWNDVTKYIYDNRQYFTAVSLLPYVGDKIYKQAPLESVTTEEDKKRFNDLLESYKPVNYKDLIETEDKTTLQDTVACAGGGCEIV